MTNITSLLGPTQDASTVLNRPITTPAELRNADQQDDELCFQTSGSTGTPKRIPYGAYELIDIARTAATGFQLAGLTEDDGIMNLGAPTPHISAWMLDCSAKLLGARTYNTDVSDFEEILKRGDEAAITVVGSTPSVIRTLGRRLEREYGPPRELFPNVRLAPTGGEPTTERLRADLRRLWGFEEIRDGYGATETGLIAMATDESRRLVPLLNRFVIEVLPDANGSDEPMDIRDVEEQTVGSILISDPNRQRLPLFRYRIGDQIRVHPADVPRIELLGREDDAISFGGALLYEMQIENALRDVYGEAMVEWKAFVSKTEADDTAARVYVVGNLDAREGAFLDALFERSTPVEEAYDLGLADGLALTSVGSVEEIERQEDVTVSDDRKVNRIVFAAESERGSRLP